MTEVWEAQLFYADTESPFRSRGLGPEHCPLPRGCRLEVPWGWEVRGALRAYRRRGGRRARALTSALSAGNFAASDWRGLRGDDRC